MGRSAPAQARRYWIAAGVIVLLWVLLLWAIWTWLIWPLFVLD